MIAKKLEIRKKNNNISIKMLKKRDGNAIKNIIEKIADKHSNNYAVIYFTFVYIL